MRKKILHKEHAVVGHKYPFKDEAEIAAITQELKDAIMLPSMDDLSPKMICFLGLFHAIDKPFHHLLVNAIDIHRIYPDKTELSNARKNLDKLLHNSDSLAANEQKIVSKATRIATVQLIKNIVIHVFCPPLGLFITAHTVVSNVKQFNEQKKRR